jgi:hypothetical protein
VTREEMDTQFQRLVVLKGMPGDTEAYWDALQDMPLDVLTAAVGHSLKTRAWWPTPAEIRLDADAARPQRPIYEPPTSYRVPLDGAVKHIIANPFGGQPIEVFVTQDLYRHCEACEDSGWMKCWCGEAENVRWPWMVRRHCGRREEHGSHDWATRCVCEETNPVIIRRKEMHAAKYATSPEKVA